MVDKTSVADWDTTPIDNDNVDGITLAENGTRPPMVNNAFRAIMSQIADLFGAAVTFSSGQKTQFQQNFDLEPGVDIPTYALTPTKLDVRRNRIVNGDMRMSQENGTTAGTTNGRYPVDQWAQYFVTSAGTLTVAQVASVTPAGSPNRLRATVTVADASLAAGEYWALTQNLEGSNVADFQYGSASAKNCVLRFGFKGPAGTYAVSLQNSAADRSFVRAFTITAGEANTDTVQTIPVNGDLGGTWLKGEGEIGITLNIVLAAGTTFQGIDGWQVGNILARPSISNGMGTGGAVFELFDVGLKLDPDATGVYGAYEIGDVDAVYQAGRYFRRFAQVWYSGYGDGSTSAPVSYLLYPLMAKTPSSSSVSTSSTVNVASIVATASRPEALVLTATSTVAGFMRTSAALTLSARLS